MKIPKIRNGLHLYILDMKHHENIQGHWHQNITQNKQCHAKTPTYHPPPEHKMKQLERIPPLKTQK
jgi:hypothetical protein